MSQQDQDRVVNRPYRLACCVALAGLATCLGAPNRGDNPPAKNPATASSRDVLRWLRGMDPEEGLRQVEKLAGGASAFTAVARATLDVPVVARGTVHAARVSNVKCLVRSSTKGSSIATVIKWVIDEGTQVKKGDKVIELDSSGLREMLRDQKSLVEQARALKVAAEENLEIQRLQSKIDLRTNEIGVKQAKRLLKKYAGGDEDEREDLKEKLELQELGLQLARLQAKAREVVALAEVKSKSGLFRQEREREKEIEAGIARCVITAPQDGVVIYPVPERGRGGAAQLTVIAPGEPVREDQTLLRVYALAPLMVTLRVHESLIGRVRRGQGATFRADALPKRVLRGRVTARSWIHTAPDGHAGGEKFYLVMVSLDDTPAGLKLGMTGAVRIEVDPQKKVLQVPLSAVLRSGGETFCYVKAQKELRERKVTVGPNNGQNVEIREGLSEGEQVLTDPAALAPHGSKTRRPERKGAPDGGRSR